MPTATPQQISNRQLAAAGNAPTASTPSLSSSGIPTADFNDQAAGALSSYLKDGTLSDQESNYEGGIMDRYNEAQANTKSAYQSEYGAINDDYANQLDQLGRDVSNDTNTANENNMGVNASVLKYYQETGENRIATLENARDNALLNNNADMAKSLNDLITQEQQFITTARQNYVTNLTGAANLETPEEKNQLTLQANQQQAVLQLAQLAPDAGISSSDSYDQAIAKFRNSNYYRNNMGQAESQIAQLEAEANAANASAGASAASAAASRATAGLTGAQTNLTQRELTYLPSADASSSSYGLLSTPGSSDPDIAALENGSETDQELQDKYAGFPDGIGGMIAANKITQAQEGGYSPLQGDINAAGATEATKAANSGSIIPVLTQTGSSLLGNAASKLGFSWNPATPVRSLSGTTLFSGKTSSGLGYTVSN